MNDSLRIALTALALAACDSPPPAGPVHIPLAAGCEMLDPEECLLPWPSSQFLEARATRTDLGVVIPMDSMPVNTAGTHLDPATWNRWDGFSAMTSMMARFEGPIDEGMSGLPTWRDPGASLSNDSPTLLLDVTSGTPVRIAHFAETEARAAGESRTTFYIRPAARLEEDHTYVVAIRDLRAPDGTPVVADPPFAALRDELPTDSPAFEARREGFEREVFDMLDPGISRSELLLAWTFHTASGETAWGDLTSMNEQAQAVVQAGDLRCEIGESRSRPDVPSSVRQVSGYIDVPYFLADPGSSADLVDVEDTTYGLARDANGAPLLSGTRRFTFLAYIPAAAIGAPARSMPIMVYGHGLWGSHDNVLDPGPEGDWSFFAADLAQRAGVIVVATNFLGMTVDDRLPVGEVLRDRIDAFPNVVDRLLQGAVATLVVGEVFAQQCFDDEALLVEGVDVIDRDPHHIVYDGDSLGGIVAPTLAALSPNMHRYAMGVGGISYPIMIPRSTHYGDVELFLRQPFPRPVDRQLLMVMFAQHWDRFEGATFAPHVFADRFDVDSPVPQVLYQVGVNDRETPQVAGDIAGRTLGLPVLSCSDAMPYDMPVVDGADETQRGAWIAFDQGGVAVPDGPSAPRATPAGTPNVHELVRRDPCAQQQVATFLRTGVVACPDPACM